MKKYKFYIIFLCLLIILSSCQSFQEGMMGTKRSKSSDEFLVHKKKPLVVPPDFEIMPSPKYFKEMEKGKKIQSEKVEASIEKLLNIKKRNGENFNESNDQSLQQSIIKKIKEN